MRKIEKSHNAKRTERGTLWNFSISILSQNSKKWRGTFGEKFCYYLNEYSTVGFSLQLQTGYLAMHLQKVLDFCIKHIFDCLVCREKGFICEVCHSNEIIYAFNVDHTVSCETCCTVFHKTCKSDYAPCPTCRRRSAYSLNRSLTDS